MKADVPEVGPRGGPSIHGVDRKEGGARMQVAGRERLFDAKVTISEDPRQIVDLR